MFTISTYISLNYRGFLRFRKGNGSNTGAAVLCSVHIILIYYYWKEHTQTHKKRNLYSPNEKQFSNENKMWSRKENERNFLLGPLSPSQFTAEVLNNLRMAKSFVIVFDEFIKCDGTENEKHNDRIIIICWLCWLCVLRTPNYILYSDVSSWVDYCYLFIRQLMVLPILSSFECVVSLSLNSIPSWIPKW